MYENDNLGCFGKVLTEKLSFSALFPPKTPLLIMDDLTLRVFYIIFRKPSEQNLFFLFIIGKPSKTKKYCDAL